MDYPAKAGYILTNDKGGAMDHGGSALGRYLLDRVAYLPYHLGGYLVCCIAKENIDGVEELRMLSPRSLWMSRA